jgi:2-polyprenyl-6-hydroxyphenyl methylase/3-demethylubiquinone-9 3-methyltransferase
MMDINSISGYQYKNASLGGHHSYILPAVLKALESLNISKDRQFLFELGCGNGSVANFLTQRGWNITGVDPSSEGIMHANKSFPKIKLQKGSAYDDLSNKYGQFPALFSLEVVEHVFAPRKYAKTIFDLLLPCGTAIISTPYHGYFKNLAMALVGKMDGHFHALEDYGHIKFWSKKTIKLLLLEAGFVDINFKLVGRIPILAKSMIVIARRP